MWWRRSVAPSGAGLQREEVLLGGQPTGIRRTSPRRFHLETTPLGTSPGGSGSGTARRRSPAQCRFALARTFVSSRATLPNEGGDHHGLPPSSDGSTWPSWRWWECPARLVH